MGSMLEQHKDSEQPQIEMRASGPQSDLQLELQQVKELCRDLSVQARELKAAGLQVHKKADGSYVTNADLQLSEVLEKQLAEIIDAPVISEENITSIDVDDLRALKEWWLIDPIDGTANYLEGYPGYSINVSLIRHGRPVLGVIAIPEESTIYSAREGGGAYKTDSDSGQDAAIEAKTSWHAPLKFGTFYKLDDAHRNRLASMLEKLGGSFDNCEPLGAALKYTSVAEGTFDIAGGWTPLKIWDVAAADILLKEAGGRLIDADSYQPLQYQLDNLDVRSALAVGQSINSI